MATAFFNLPPIDSDQLAVGRLNTFTSNTDEIQFWYYANPQHTQTATKNLQSPFETSFDIATEVIDGTWWTDPFAFRLFSNILNPNTNKPYDFFQNQTDVNTNKIGIWQYFGIGYLNSHLKTDNFVQQYPATGVEVFRVTLKNEPTLTYNPGQGVNGSEGWYIGSLQMRLRMLYDADATGVVTNHYFMLDITANFDIFGDGQTTYTLQVPMQNSTGGVTYVNDYQTGFGNYTADLNVGFIYALGLITGLEYTVDLTSHTLQAKKVLIPHFQYLLLDGVSTNSSTTLFSLRKLQRGEELDFREREKMKDEVKSVQGNTNNLQIIDDINHIAFPYEGRLAEFKDKFMKYAALGGMYRLPNLQPPPTSGTETSGGLTIEADGPYQNPIIYTDFQATTDAHFVDDVLARWYVFRKPPRWGFYAGYGFDGLWEADWGNGVLTGVATGSLNVTNGMLNLTGGYMDYQADKNITNFERTTYEIQIYTNYSGTPTATQYLFSVGDVTFFNNGVQLYHDAADGHLRVDIAIGGTVTTFDMGLWSPVAGTKYKVVLQLDLIEGTSWLVINNQTINSAINLKGAFTVPPVTIRLGSDVKTGTENSNFSIDYFAAYTPTQGSTIFNFPQDAPKPALVTAPFITQETNSILIYSPESKSWSTYPSKGYDSFAVTERPPDKGRLFAVKKEAMNFVYEVMDGYGNSSFHALTHLDPIDNDFTLAKRIQRMIINAGTEGDTDIQTAMIDNKGGKNLATTSVKTGDYLASAEQSDGKDLASTLASSRELKSHIITPETGKNVSSVALEIKGTTNEKTQIKEISVDYERKQAKYRE